MSSSLSALCLTPSALTHFPLLYCLSLDRIPQQSCPVQVFDTPMRAERAEGSEGCWELALVAPFRISPSHQHTVLIIWRQISLQFLCHFSFPVSFGIDRERKREDSSPDREEFRRAPPRSNFLFYSLSKLGCFISKTLGFSVTSHLLTAASGNKFILKLFFFFKRRIWHLFTRSRVIMNQSLFYTWQ